MDSSKPKIQSGGKTLVASSNSSLDSSSSGGSYGAIKPDIIIDTSVHVSTKKRNGRLPTWFKDELKQLLYLAWYLSVINLFSNIMGTISVMFCGHLGTVELDGVSMACSLLNVLGICIANGLCTACDTLFSQSFGRKNKKQIGIYLQRGLIIITLFVLPCWGLHLNAEAILLALGQHPGVAQIAGRYLLLLMPGTLQPPYNIECFNCILQCALFFFLQALFILRVLTTYLRSQNILWPTMLVGVIGTVVNVIMHVLLINVLEMGTDGSAIAQATAFVMMLVVLLVYILGSGMYKDSWDGWSVKAFYDWGQFLYIGVAGMMMLFLSVFGMEIGSFLAGILSEVELGAQSILFNTEVIIFTIPFGFGIACNIRVGQLLGASDAKGAKQAAIIGLGIAVTTVVSIGVLGTILRYELPRIFSSESDVINLTAEVFPLLFLAYALDGIDVCFLGILRGCNRETIATVITFIAYYAIGVPLAIVLLFVVSVGLSGFWYGIVAGLTVGTISLAVVLAKTDWEKQMNEALERAGASKPLKESDIESQTVKKSHLPDLMAANDDCPSELEDDEKKVLLSYRKVADVKTQKRLMKFQKILCNPVVVRTQMQVRMDPGEPTTQKKKSDISTTYLIVTRCTFIFLMFLTFILGLFGAIFFQPIYEGSSTFDLCIPRNSTNGTEVLAFNGTAFIANTTIPFCP
ncbi:multidrug and toxin extrusion protein 1-like [Lineus longissimus]|uniref:multidrug and toxin extrusion protein 1-like n=1 Tax=Lineus longissimus TaxID=88925 RepID=UPI00315DD162